MADDNTPEHKEAPLKKGVSPALKGLRTAGILFASILILAVGAGVLYVWLGSPAAPAVSLDAPKAKPQLQEREAPKLDPNAPVGVSVQSINSPAAPGDNVLLIAKTKPEAICQIMVEYDEVKSKDSGLREKKADVFGVVQWSWAVDEAAPVGKWPVTIECRFDKKSGVVIHDLVIKKAA